MRLIIISITLFLSNFAFTQESIKVEKLKSSHRTIYTDIIINAKPEQVWDVLADFETYEDWAIFFMGIKGDFRDGGKIDATVQTNVEKNKRRTISHNLKVKNGSYFSWSDPFAMGMVDNHTFRVEATEDGKTRFIQTDGCIKGMTWLLGGGVMKFGKENYPLFNRALKAEVERRFSKIK